MNTCPPDVELVELVEGRLSQRDTGAIEEHVDRCSACRRVLAEIGRQEAASAPAPSEIDTPPLASQPPPPLARGAVLGRYVVIDVLGAGGMGVVYAAFDPELDRKVALKVLRGDVSLGASGAAIRVRLAREAQAMAKLSHPNVVIVHDVGLFDRGAVDGEAEIFVAMELLDGGSAAAFCRAPDRSWREVLDLYKKAGRGLAAAHAAGIVHRDFKPDNVLLGEDGRVRVTDFGLARADEVEAAEHGDERAIVEPPVTRTGAKLGTPAYMAPEQHAGERAGAAADQFAFAVSLYEGIYGERPFEGTTIGELASAVRGGRLRAEPRTRRAPLWIRKTLVRALAVDPNDRYPSMDALLAELDRDRSRLARGLGVIGGAIVAGALSVFVLRGAPASRERICSSAPSRISGIWDADRKRALERSFGDRPFAKDALRVTLAALDAYAADWTKARADACEATAVRGEQSEHVRDVRMACLDRRLTELSEVVKLLATGADDVVARAPDMAAALPPVKGCSAQALVGPVEPPAGAEAEAKMRAAEAKIAEANALLGAGRFAEGAPIAAEGAELARATGHAPLEAEALAVRADFEFRNEKNLEAKSTYEEALWAADRGRADDLRASVACKLVYLVAYRMRRYEDAERLRGAAEAALRRAGGSDELEADLWNSMGAVALEQQKVAEAIACFEKSLAIVTRRYGQDDDHVAAATDSLAAAYSAKGDFSKSVELERRAVAIYEAKLGPFFPDIAMALDGLASSLSALGKYDDAIAEARRGLAIREAAMRPDNPWIALTHLNIAEVMRQAQRFDDALHELDTAIALGSVKDPVHLAQLHGTRGGVLSDLGRKKEAADELRQSIALSLGAAGELDPALAFTRMDLAGILIEAKKYREAREEVEKALRAYEVSRGPDHPYVSDALSVLGEIDLDEGHPERALPKLERGVAICEARECEPRQGAWVRYLLAKAVLATKSDKDRARALAKASSEIYGGMGNVAREEAAEVAAFLKALR